MNEGVFKYSVLQFVPSQVLDERVNIGILFFFPEEHKMKFICPDSLHRIKALFHKVKENKIKIYLNFIKEKVHDLNDNQSLFYSRFNEFDDLLNFVDSQVLKADDSSLQFSETFQSLKYTQDLDQIVTDFKREYFSEYFQYKKYEHISDADLQRIFENFLKNRASQLVSKLKKDVKVETEDHQFTFDFAWQNGSLNLVKAVSFDLKEARNIQEKSVLLYGNLDLLQEISSKNDYRFDLLVAKPEDQKLYPAFERALKTVDKAGVKKNIIFQDQIEEYAKQAIEYLSFQ
ncbi:MAG: DUF3037 domain-containing protein [Marinilabilia sp.]